MKKLICAWLFLIFLFSSILFAADFKPYPGAKLDNTATKEANETAQAAKMSNVKTTNYTTADSFQKVASFYKGIAKEYTMPRASGTSGKPKNTKTTN